MKRAPARRQIDLLDEAGDLHRHRPRNHGRRDAPGAYALRDEARRHRRQHGCDREGGPAGAHREGQRGKQRQRDVGGKRGFAVGGQRQDRAGARRYRQPERGAAEGVFFLDRGGEPVPQRVAERSEPRAKTVDGFADLMRMTYGDLRHAPTRQTNT